MTSILLRHSRILSYVIATQGYVLTWRGDRFTARWRENIVRSEHQHARFQLRLDRQRNVYCHLVAVEVGVVRGANERVNANGFTFDQLRFKRLNREAVQSRSTIQEHRMAPGYFVQNVPHLRCLALDHFLCAADGVYIPEVFQAANDEWLEENQCHLLRQPALIQLEFRTDDNHRAARVIDA